MQFLAAADDAPLGRRQRDAAALIAGALTPLAFAPFHLFPLAILAPAVLFLTWQRASAGRAAWRGFLYGVGLFGVGVSWVYVSLHTFGNMPAPLAGFAVVLFVAGLAVFPAAAGWLQAQFAPLAAGWRLALAVPAAWVLLEWTRGWLLTGFPWLNLGYSQTDTPLAGFAAALGVYGMSLAVSVTAGLFAAAWLERRRALFLYLPIAVALWLLAAAAAQIAWVIPAGSPLRVALVQANIPISIKWQSEHRQAVIDRYVSLSEQAPSADLVVWPEAAIPGYFDKVAPGLAPRLKRIAHERSPDFLIGAVEQDPRGRAYYNSVFVVGAHQGSYRKQHLVPFGEFLPLPGVFGWLIEHLQIPMSDFSRGAADQALLIAAGQPIGVSVCYEDAFGEELIRALPTATLFVNVSEDAWFGKSLAPHQRLQMARVRALEAGRPMLRAANTGPSAIIDHRGTVLATSPQFEPHVLLGSAQPMQGATLYARFGNIPVVLLVSLLLALGYGRSLYIGRNPGPKG
jgi:apolipoprotein N-acyltransferase